MRLCCFILMSALVATHAQAQQSPVEMLDFGVICDVETNGQVDAPETASGVLNLVDQNREIDVTTTEVPAHLGLSFGLRTRMQPETSMRGLRIVVTHPPMGPNNITRQSWAAPMAAGQTGVNLYTFDNKHELVKGIWRFQLMFSDAVLLEKVFEVLPKGTVPAVQHTCLGQSLTS